jgi:PKD repeat protein
MRGAREGIAAVVVLALLVALAAATPASARDCAALGEVEVKARGVGCAKARGVIRKHLAEREQARWRCADRERRVVCRNRKRGARAVGRLPGGEGGGDDAGGSPDGGSGSGGGGAETGPPNAAFSIDRDGGPAPAVVEFSDDSTGAVDSWRWQFGDGSDDAGEPNPVHAFRRPGSYEVRLTVRGPEGTSQATRAIDVGPALDPIPEQGGVAEFVARCPLSHRLPDDPIIYPGRPGASHLHDFFGNTGTDAFSTYESLLADGTNCDPLPDRSPYWVPSLYAPGGERIATEQATFYYLSGHDERQDVRAFPRGLRVVAGNSKATEPQSTRVIQWGCLGVNRPATSAMAEPCPAGSKLELYVDFPDCWNGRDRDAPDHQSHMAYSNGGECPPGHPIAVPRLQFKLRYPVLGGPGFELSSGEAITAHGDFLNAWEQDELVRRVEDCLHRTSSATRRAT